MAQYSTAVVNAVLDSAESTVGTSPLLIVYSGALPASCASPDPTGVLVTFPLPSDWLTAAASGTKVLSGGAAQAIATGTGIALSFRVKDSSGTVCAMQGSVTVRGGGGDLTLSSLNIRAGQKVRVGTFTITTQVSAVLAIIQANQTLIATGTVGGGGTGTSGTPFTIFRTGVSYATLQQAHDAAIDNDTIKVTYGAYSGFSAFTAGSPRLICTKNGLTIEWETPGLIPTFDYGPVAIGETNVGGGGTAIDMAPSCTSLTIRGIEIVGAQIPHASQHVFLNIESGYPGNVTPYVATLEYCSLKKFTNGVLTGPNVGGVVNIRYCLLENNGGGDGLSHGVYISDISTINAIGNTFRTTPNGVGSGPAGDDLPHLFKSRARFGNLDANIFDGAGGCSRPLDIPNGGTYVFRGCFMHKYVDTAPGQCIRFGAEQRDGQATFIFDGRAHAITFEQCTFKNDTNTNVMLIDAITDGSLTSTLVPVTKTIRNNIAAGTFASDITSFVNNAEVALAQISASGQLTIGSIAGTQNDATTEYSGLFAVPVARSDSNKGAFQNGLPAWMPTTAFAYADVPGSTPSLYLKNDGSGVLPAAFSAGGGNQESSYRQCNSYGTAGWSEKNKEFWLFGGGHLATNMNPLVKARLNQASPDWVAIDAGSTAARIQADYDGGSWDGSAYQTDGRPKSTHTYRGNNYFDSIDEFVQVGGPATNSTPTGPGHGEYSDCYGWPRSGSAWRAQNYWPQVPSGGTITDSGQCPDPNGNGVYVIRSGNPLWRLDAATRSWSTIGGGIFHNWIGGQAPEAHKMGANLAGQILAITIIGDFTAGVPYTLRYISTTTGVETPLTLSGDAFPIFISTGMRPTNVVYAEANGKWYVTFCTDDGNFGSSPQPLYSITPTGPNTATVALVSVTGTQPTGGLRGGLYYSRDWKCLLVYNGWARPIQVLRVV